MKRIVLIFCLLSSLAFADTEPWRANYERGLQLIAQGKYEDAINFLRMAVADKPISDIIQTPQPSLEYLPYLQLGVCYASLKRFELASEYFELEKSLQPIEHSKSGQDLMKQYEDRIRASGGSRGKQADEGMRHYTGKPYLLADLEVNKMKEEIRTHCNLPRAPEESYPWYFHYELGKALENKGDWQRALESFLQALDHLDRPQKSSRTYGMWFIDYYPYYNIGLSHFRLQNWKCAENAFQLSMMYEDIPAGSPENANLQEMRAEAEANLQTESKK